MAHVTIVVVDDDLQIVQMLKSQLEEEGYRVFAGYDGQMALQLAQAQKPDLMVMDVNMPMTNGLKALEFLRKSPATQGIPVIFLTGAPSQSVYPTVEANTRVAYVKKPLDIESLSSLIRQFLTKYHK